MDSNNWRPAQGGGEAIGGLSFNLIRDKGSLDSTAQTGNANPGDWQEDVYQKIKAMKQMYLPELNDMYQKIAGKLQRHDQLENDKLEKLNRFRTMLERIIAFLQVPKRNIVPGYKEKLAQTGNANPGDWQEEVYQKIKAMKEMYLPKLNNMYRKIAGKLQMHEGHPQQPKNEQLEKLKIFKTMLERIIMFLQVPKGSIVPGYKDKLVSYEKQIINFLDANRSRKPEPSYE